MNFFELTVTMFVFLLLLSILGGCAGKQHLDDEGMLIYCIGICAAIDTDRHHSGETKLTRKEASKSED